TYALDGSTGLPRRPKTPELGGEAVARDDAGEAGFCRAGRRGALRAGHDAFLSQGGRGCARSKGSARKSGRESGWRKIRCGEHAGSATFGKLPCSKKYGDHGAGQLGTERGAGD